MNYTRTLSACLPDHTKISMQMTEYISHRNALSPEQHSRAMEEIVSYGQRMENMLIDRLDGMVSQREFATAGEALSLLDDTTYLHLRLKERLEQELGPEARLLFRGTKLRNVNIEQNMCGKPTDEGTEPAGGIGLIYTVA